MNFTNFRRWAIEVPSLEFLLALGHDGDLGKIERKFVLV